VQLQAPIPQYATSCVTGNVVAEIDGNFYVQIVPKNADEVWFSNLKNQVIDLTKDA